MIDTFRDFLKLETASGILLVAAAVLAMLVANSPLAPLYGSLIDLPVGIRVGALEIEKPLLLWINDGLMAIFFFLVGLELKREVLEGQLSDPREIVLPALGAFGGMVFPAAIYIWINQGDSTAIQGWAIPAATDIAFALAILALLGSRVPGAIAIIALFYTSDLSVAALVTAGACLPVLALLNRRGVLERTPYILIGLVMWIAVLKSGVHATLAGVILAVFIPLRDRAKERSPLHEIEHDLHTAVAFGILPIFAFANAGIALGGLSFESFLHPVPLGIMAGLFVGKQVGVGVFVFCGLGVMLGIARLPDDLRWAHIYGTALLCGVGFTMSLFIGSLAFEATGVNLLFDERLGIIAGSLLSGACGYLVLRMTLPERIRSES